MELLTELLEHELEDYGYTWTTELTYDSGDYKQYDVTFSIDDIQEGEPVSFNVYDDYVEVLAYTDGWEVVEWWGNSVKWLWIALLPTWSDYNSVVSTSEKYRAAYTDLHIKYKPVK